MASEPEFRQGISWLPHFHSCLYPSLCDPSLTSNVILFIHSKLGMKLIKVCFFLFPLKSFAAGLGVDFFYFVLEAEVM